MNQGDEGQWEPLVTIDVVSVRRGAVDEPTPQADTAKEASAITTKASWRRDMDDSRVGWNGSGEPSSEG